MNIALIWKILRILLIVVIVIMTIPLYILFGFGTLFAFDDPHSVNLVNILKLLVMDITVFATPIAMIIGLILGNKLNQKYYLLTLISPILLFVVIKWFFIDA